MLKIYIIALLVISACAIKNPCRKNKEKEFHSHPNSVNSYIQCSKHGEMFIKECPGSSQWDDNKSKCTVDKEKSEIKTLSLKHKIKKAEDSGERTVSLAAKKNMTVSQSDLDALQLQKDILEKEKLIEELEIESRNNAAEEHSQKRIDTILKQQTQRETLQFNDQVANQNLLNDMGQEVIDSIRDEQIGREQMLMNQQIANQKKLMENAKKLWSMQQLEALNKVTVEINEEEQKENDAKEKEQQDSDKKEIVMSLREAQQLKQQQLLLELMNKQSRENQMQMHFDNMKVVQEQRNNQADQLRNMMKEQDLHNRQSIVTKQDLDEKLRLQRARENELISQQIAQRKKNTILKNSHFLRVIEAQQSMRSRKAKELQMCSEVTCPQGFECSLKENDELMCVRV